MCAPQRNFTPQRYLSRPNYRCEITQWTSNISPSRATLDYLETASYDAELSDSEGRIDHL